MLSFFSFCPPGLYQKQKVKRYKEEALHRKKKKTKNEKQKETEREREKDYFFFLNKKKSFSLAQRRLQHFDELPALVRLDHDVAPAEELAPDIHLRERRPRAEFFQAGAEPVVGQDVDGLERHVRRAQDLHDGVGEAALREVLRALDERDDAVFLDEVVEGGSEFRGEAGGATFFFFWLRFFFL